MGFSITELLRNRVGLKCAKTFDIIGDYLKVLVFIP